MATLVNKGDLVADLIKDPRGLAEEVYKAGLMSQEEMVTLTEDYTKDDRTKAYDILHHIGVKVSTDPHLSRIALMTLLRLPGAQNIIKESGKLIAIIQ